MSRAGLTLKLKERWGRDWMFFILSLILAFVIWLIHNLSLDYFSYLQYRVAVETSIEGYVPESYSEENIVIHGKATGIFFLENGRMSQRTSEMKLTLDPSVFHKDASEGMFFVRVSDIREVLSEYFGEQMSIDHISADILHFYFEPATCKKVAVVPQTTITYRPQFMAVGEMEVTPDSVMLYGSESDLENISSVRTKVISRHNLDKSLHGYVQLEKLSDFRVDEDRIQYSLNVQRYVELSSEVNVETSHVPSNKSIIVLPSSVNLTYRVPINELHGDRRSQHIKAVVDYPKLVQSNASRIIPSIDYGDLNVLSSTMDPPFVECIVSER